MTPDLIALALLLLGALLVLAKIVRSRSAWLCRLFLPASIIAGAVALLLGDEVLGRIVAATAGEAAPLANGLFGEEILEVWGTLPGLLISVVFATLFLGHRIPKAREVWHRGGPQLSLGITMGAGQYVIGILLCVLLLTPLTGINPMAGALIEIGFEGGHGTAAGLADTFVELGFPEGADLAVGMATIGIVSGVVIGVALINWGVRRGRTQIIDRAERSFQEERGIFDLKQRQPAAMLTVNPGSVEPLALHFGLVALAVLVGVVILEALQALEAATWGQAGVEVFAFVPLFPLAMLGGVVVQVLIDRLDRYSVVDRGMMLRIQGLALDLLIVAALATLSLQVIGVFIVPFLALGVAGVLWNVAAFLLLAPRMIPTFPFERGITDLGQSMGVTATGLLLLRVVDPENASPALESFGYKQLGFEPFLGGGLITGLSLPLIAQLGPLPFAGAMALLLVGALALGLGYFGRKGEVVGETA